MTAVNYHLKWDSHSSYLNSSVATLYKNEKFADVVLYSSNTNNNGNSDIPTVGISAHKFILSSCSQFFATMFETAPITTPNGVIYVVLPPDLSHRAIQILVQYMYSGEATVSNDIVNEVLRGGEILKIRGLCRTNSTSSTHHHSHHHSQGHQRETSNGGSTHYGSNGARGGPPLTTMSTSTQLTHEVYGNSGSGGGVANKCHHPTGSSSSSNNCATTTSRYAVDHTSSSQQQQQFRGLGASVMPKDSPAIVKSPKLTHAGLLSIAASSKHHSGISINKEVAIDPEDKCCYQATSLAQQEVLHAAAIHTAPPPAQPQPQAMTVCTEVGCRSCPMTAAESDNETFRQRRRGERNSRNDERDYVEPRPPDEHMIVDREELPASMVFTSRLRRDGASGERVREFYAPEHFESAQMNIKPFVETNIAATARLTTPPHPHNFLAIKQEPTDWSNSVPTPTNENSSDMMQQQHRPPTPTTLHSPKQPLDFKMPLGSAAVKLEANSSATCGGTPLDDQEQPESKHYNNNFKVIICEICQKSFEDNKTLVRHLETHATTSSTLMTSNGVVGVGAGTTAGVDATLTKSYVPKKRRRISQQENNMDHVTLLCDLCTTSFETPAEWVRHMNNQHTEIELAMFNSKKDGEHKNNMNNNDNNTNTNSSSICSGSSNISSSSSASNLKSNATISSIQIQQQQSTNTINNNKKYTTNTSCCSNSSSVATATTTTNNNSNINQRQSFTLHKRPGTVATTNNNNDNPAVNSNLSTSHITSTTIFQNDSGDILCSDTSSHA